MQATNLAIILRPQLIILIFPFLSLFSFMFSFMQHHPNAIGERITGQNQV